MPFYCVDICSDGEKTMVGETNGTLVQIEAVSPNGNTSHYIALCPALVENKMLV